MAEGDDVKSTTKRGRKGPFEVGVVAVGVVVVLFLALVGGVTAKDDAKNAKDDVGTVIGIDLGTTYSW